MKIIEGKCSGYFKYSPKNQRKNFYRENQIKFPNQV